MAVSVDGQVVRLSAEKTDEKDEERVDPAGVKRHFIERNTRFAARTLMLPENANMTGASLRPRRRSSSLLLTEASRAFRAACARRLFT